MKRNRDDFTLMAVATEVYFRSLDKLRFELDNDLTKRFQNIIRTKITQEKHPHKSCSSQLYYPKNGNNNIPGYLELLCDPQIHNYNSPDIFNAHLVFDRPSTVH